MKFLLISLKVCHPWRFAPSAPPCVATPLHTIHSLLLWLDFLLRCERSLRSSPELRVVCLLDRTIQVSSLTNYRASSPSNSASAETELNDDDIDVSKNYKAIGFALCTHSGSRSMYTAIIHEVIIARRMLCVVAWV